MLVIVGSCLGIKVLCAYIYIELICDNHTVMNLALYTILIYWTCSCDKYCKLTKFIYFHKAKFSSSKGITIPLISTGTLFKMQLMTLKFVNLQYGWMWCMVCVCFIVSLNKLQLKMNVNLQCTNKNLCSH